MLAHRSWRWRTLIPAALLVFALAFGVACDDDDDGNGDATPGTDATSQVTAPANGDGDEDTTAIEQAIRDAAAAWNASDVEALLASFTEQGALAAFAEGEEGATVEQLREVLPEFIGSEPIGDPEFEDTQVDGDSAETTVLWTFGNVYEHVRFSLVNEAGEWKIDGEERLTVDIPDGTETIDVEMDEFSFTYDVAAASAGGQIAFAADNVGEQEHEIALARIPADADINELLTSEEEPAGVEFIGGSSADPGDSTNLVFMNPLEPGRYLMVCFLPDTTEGAEGQPHALLGMVSEFTIE